MVKGNDSPTEQEGNRGFSLTATQRTKEEGEEESIKTRRREQEQYAGQLVMFMRDRLGMFVAGNSGGSTTAPLDENWNSASGSTGGEASKMLDQLHKRFGASGSPEKVKHTPQKKSIRTRRRESRLWQRLEGVEVNIDGAGVGREDERDGLETSNPHSACEEEEAKEVK